MLTDDQVIQYLLDHGNRTRVLEKLKEQMCTKCGSTYGPERDCWCDHETGVDLEAVRDE